MKNSKITDQQLSIICKLLERKFRNEERRNKYAPVKEVLTLLGKGALLTMLLIAPGTAQAVRKQIYKQKSDDSWKRYNSSYLRRTIENLGRQRCIKIVDESDSCAVSLTERGKHGVLKYALDELELDTSKPWDGKWRIVIYDIPDTLRHVRNELGSILKRMNFLRIQKSVYLTPFACEQEVEFIRLHFGQEKNITLLTAGSLEHGHVYQEYFGI